MGFARRLTRPRIAEFHRGLALLLSLVRYPETRGSAVSASITNASVVARAVLGKCSRSTSVRIRRGVPLRRSDEVSEAPLRLGRREEPVGDLAHQPVQRGALAPIARHFRLVSNDAASSVRLDEISLRREDRRAPRMVED